MLSIYRPAFLRGRTSVAVSPVVWGSSMLNEPPKQRGPAARRVADQTNQSIAILALDVAANSYSSYR